MGQRWCLLLLVCLSMLLADCGGGTSEHRTESPLAPSASPGGVPAVAAADATPARATTAAAAPAALPPEALAATSPIVLFPPRDESFAFRNALEAKYRDGLRRSPSTTHVDAEGDVVWLQEYLRYRANGCGHDASAQYVLDEIDGRPAAPTCAEARGGTVPFPPRNESYAFRQELEAKYQVGLRRPASSSYADIEGSLVWVQEYLRYRVNECDHGTAQGKVFDQIDGKGIAPDCRPVVAPVERTLSGIWHGTSDYPNAPFEMHLVQSGSKVSGTWRDRKDAGSVVDYPGDEEVSLLVYFGDAGLLVRGRFTDDYHVDGTIAYGGRRWAFRMYK